jgi:hypothetical protein
MPIDPELKEQVYIDVNYRLKGGGSADGAGEIFCGRVRVRLRCVHGNQLRTSAAVCLSRAPSTTANLKSVESKYCTSNEWDARSPECAPSTLRGEPAADRPGFAADHRFDR